MTAEAVFSAWTSSTFSAPHTVYLPLCRAALNPAPNDGVTMSGDDSNADNITAEGGRV